jgi:hypothetical protein
MRTFIAKDNSLTQHQENLVDTWKENFETSYRPMKCMPNILYYSHYTNI